MCFEHIFDLSLLDINFSDFSSAAVNCKKDEGVCASKDADHQEDKATAPPLSSGPGGV